MNTEEKVAGYLKIAELFAELLKEGYLLCNKSSIIEKVKSCAKKMDNNGKEEDVILVSDVLKILDKEIKEVE